VKVARAENLPQPSEGDVRVDCAFCTGYWETRRTSYGLVHTVPYCKEYEAMDVVEFMQASRRKMGIVHPSDDN